MDEVLAPPAACPFPMSRDSSRPLDLPAGYLRPGEGPPVRQVIMPGGDRAWLVSRHEDVRAVLADDRFSSKVADPGYPKLFFPEGGPPGAFVQVDPPEHTRLRRMVMGQFTKKRAEEMRPYIQELVDERIDAVLAGPRPADLMSAFARPVPLAVICKLLGVPYGDRVAFGRWVNLLNEPTSSPAANKAAAGSLFMYLRKLVADKEKNPTDDVLGDLAAGQLRTGEVTRDEVTAMALMLLSAGFDTTASSIGLSVLALLEHPAEFTRLRDNPDLVVGAVEELLRYQNIMQWGVGRVAKDDVELAGQRIRAGDGVVVLLCAADRDEAVHPDPDRLDITRGGSTSLSFGHGIHSCVAKFLSRVELQVALGTLVRRIPGLRLVKPANELKFRDNAMAYGLRELPVVW